MFANVKNKGIITFVVILFICSLFYTSILLDFTLTPRFFLLSIFLLGFLTIYKGFNAELEITIINLSFLLYIILSTFSFLWALNPYETWFIAVKSVCSYTMFVLAIYFMRKNKNSISYIYKVAGIIAGIALSLSFIEFNEITIFNIHFNSNESPTYYITSINSHKNLLSSFLFILVPFLFLGFNRVKGKSKYYYCVLLILLFILLYILKTRAVWFATLLSVVLYLGLFVSIKKDKLFIKLYVSSLIVLGLCFVLFFVLNSGNTQIDKTSLLRADSLIERVLIWKNTLKMIFEHFWLGVGGGNWQIFFPKYSLQGIWRCDEMNVTFQRPHNDFLWIWSEYGFVGFMLKMIVFIGVLLPAFNAIKNESNQLKQKLELSIFISCYIANVCIMAFDFPSERAEHTIWTSVLMAFIYTSSENYYKPYFSIYYSKWIKAVIIIILLSCTIVCFLKMKGEYFTKKVYVAKRNNDYVNVIRFSKSAESFAYSLDPVSMPVSWYRGNAFIALHELNEGMLCYIDAYTLHRFNRYCLNDLATCYVLKNRFSKAEKLYLESARISPRYDEAVLNLISLYVKTNQIQKAKYWDSKLCHDSPRRTDLKRILNNND
jgi:O-antigen ligase